MAHKLWKILKEVEIADDFAYLLRNLYAGQEATAKTRHGTQIGSKLGKEYVKAIYCHPAYLTSVQSTSCTMPGWMNHRLESRLPREMSTTSDMQMIPTLMAESEEELKSLFTRVKEKSEKAGLKLNIQKLRSWHLAPSLNGK